ncbi:HEAT repeat domain-containing protein [Nonomuraea insulae]|uniref:HEAT repeat domain-containing protein n=1 Tax=Nonomuraea insulae TaxID=1616787 RepID=A0ABW1CBL1_9ACTN
MIYIPWLSELQAIDWATTEIAYGNASEIPETLVRLASDNANEQTEAYDNIRNFLVSEGMRFNAASYAIPFLIRLLQEGLTLRSASVLELLAELTFREESDYLIEGILLHETYMEIPSALEVSMYDGDEKSLSIDLYYKVAAGVPLYCDYLQTGTLPERIQAAALIGYFPGEKSYAKSFLLDTFTSSAPSALAGTAQIAAGLIGLPSSDPEVNSVLTDRLQHEDRLIRWAAAIALAWSTRTAHGYIADLLHECKSLAKEESTEIPYLHGNTWILADLALRSCQS